jgi:transposase-like protein
MKMKRYSVEFKQWVVEQMMPPVNCALETLARETGVTTVTLRTWRNAARDEGRIVPGNGKKSDRWSSADKFRVVLETAPMSEAELSEYCRVKGIQPQQVQQWRTACEQANDGPMRSAAVPAGLVSQRKIDRLEKDLARKDAALAEAAALLMLRKKAEAIWGKDEDE